MRRGLEVGEDAIPEDGVKNGSDDVFGVGLVGKDVDAEGCDSSFFHAEGIGYCLVHVARKAVESNLSMSFSIRQGSVVDDDRLL